MIGVMVTFRYESAFDIAAVQRLADTAQVRFAGMSGLRLKAFTFSPTRREATNFYLWDSEPVARAFFSPELLERVTRLYGVKPSVDFVQIAALVDNGPR